MGELDWQRARRDRRALDRRLPLRLRRVVSVIRRDDLGDELASSILTDAADVARARDDGGLRHVQEAVGEAWPYVLPVAEREILNGFDQNPMYRAQVKARVRRILRSLHGVKIDPGAEELTVPRWLGPTPTIVDAHLDVESDIGLGTASVLEAEPEAWNHWVASEIIRTWSPASINDANTSRVLVMGALAGGFARVVTALDQKLPTFIVSETDWVLNAATNLPCVEGRGIIDDKTRFDAAVVVLPSPATSEASSQRCIYDNQTDFDPGRLGPTRWTRAAANIVEVVANVMTAAARAYVLVPMGVRIRRGYIQDAELLERVLEAVRASGLVVEAEIPTVEIGPVARPFVGTNRSAKTTLVLKKAAT